MLNDDTVGFRSMTGGVDGENVATPTHSVSKSIAHDGGLFGCSKFCVDNDSQSPSRNIAERLCRWMT